MSEISEQRSRVQKLKRRYEKWQATRRQLKTAKQKNRARLAQATTMVGRTYREYAKARLKLSRLRAEAKEKNKTGLTRYAGGARVSYEVARRLGRVGGITTNGPRAGLRTYEEQAQLYNAYLNGTGAPAFPPWGPSKHLLKNMGRDGLHAVDVAQGSRLDAAAGWSRPYSYEPWHCEPN